MRARAMQGDRGRARVRGERARRAARRPVVVALIAVASACGHADEKPPTESDASFTLSLVETLGGLDTAGYARALEVRDFVFPEDHGPHEDFRTEWWYVTGNLEADDGRMFGFQFTIFRSALAPTPPGGPSAWATNQAYMGHFALTDVDRDVFRATELFARGGGGLAGASAEPFRVWLEDWRLESTGGAPGGDGAAGTPGGTRPPSVPRDPAAIVFPLRLSADQAGVELELVLEAGKPHVRQGEDGLSQKGPEPGNASFYYAHTRMPASGRIVEDGDTVAVTGLAWLDREWSTSALSEGQVGWDWFALQLDDGWEMMVYQLRRDDGTADALSDGVLIDPTGRRIPLEWGTEVRVEPTGTWTSPVDGSVYPSGWRIAVPERGWDLTVEPAVLDQELRVAFRYWEGSVRVSGQGEAGRRIGGRGYVELTGYTGGS
jgi:predicted secreted hydrolase